MKLNVVQPGSDEDPWYTDGLQFSCTQCGNCCTGGPGFVWISREEIVRLAEFLCLTPEQTVERYCRKIDGRFSLNEQLGSSGKYDCVFLQEMDLAAEVDGQTVTQRRRTCAIYPVRPLQCRTWPFWPENLASQRAWNLASRRCPGMDVGKRYSQKKIEQIRDATDWL